MLRGAVIVFTGLFSIAFLRRKLGVWEWIGIVFVIGGLACVGASDILTMDGTDMNVNAVLTGDMLIIFAQVFYLTAIIAPYCQQLICKFHLNIKLRNCL